MHPEDEADMWAKTADCVMVGWHSTFLPVSITLHYLLFKNAFGLTMTSSFQLTKRKTHAIFKQWT